MEGVKIEFTVTTEVCPEIDWLHAATEASLTFVIAKVDTLAADVDTGIVILLPAVVLIVCEAPPFSVYVNVYGDTPFEPVNVTFGLVAFTHTLVVPEIVAEGIVFTVKVAGFEVIEHKPVVVSVTTTLY